MPSQINSGLWAWHSILGDSMTSIFQVNNTLKDLSDGYVLIHGIAADVGLKIVSVGVDA